MLKDQIFKTSRLQFDDWLSEPEKFSGLSRNRPLDRQEGQSRRHVSSSKMGVPYMCSVFVKAGQTLCLVDNSSFFHASIEDFGMLKGVDR